MRSSECGARNKKWIAFIVFFLLLSVTSFAGQDQQIHQKLSDLEKIHGKFSFIVIGDNRSGDDIYQKMIPMIMQRKPAFIIHTGDMIVNAGNEEQWSNFWKMSKPITVPYFFSIGNHDAHPTVLGSEKVYKGQVDLPGNELYYAFIAGNSLFAVLDSSLGDQEKKITGRQFQWLGSLLSTSKLKHKFVFVHYPLYPEQGKGKHFGNSLDFHKEERDKLQALFKKHNVTAVFNGHEHLYLRKTVDGVTHVITGGAGARLYAREKKGGFHHFVEVTVNGDKVSAQVIDIKGKVRDRF